MTTITALESLEAQATTLTEASAALGNEATVSAALREAGVPAPNEVAGFLANVRLLLLLHWAALGCPGLP